MYFKINRIVKSFLLVCFLMIVSSIQVYAETDPNDPVDTPPEETVVLAVKQDAFNAADMANFRRVGSTILSGTGVSLVQDQNYQAGSFFTAQRIFMPDAENAGFSTYFEMETSGGGNGFADGFTFIVSQFTNVLGAAGGAIGYGGIRNSVAILFDSYDNGGQPPLCISLGLEGSQGSCKHFTSNFRGLQRWRIWIDYSKTAKMMEVRINQFNNTRPETAFSTYSNLDLSSNIGNEFYTGFTSSTGGATQNTMLRKWYFSAVFTPNGIDPTFDYEVSILPPMTPNIEITSFSDSKNGWLLNPSPNINEVIENVSYLYQFDNLPRQFYNEDVYLPDGVRTLKIYAISPAGHISSGFAEVKLNRGLFLYNYPGSKNITRFYPDIGEWELFTPIRLGYRFLGWTKQFDYDPLGVIETSRFQTDNIFIAHWELENFTIQFNTNTDIEINPIESTIHEPFEVPDNPTKPFHTFEGWYLDEAFQTPFDLQNYNYKSVTLHAKWAINVYPVQFYGLNDVVKVDVSHNDYVVPLDNRVSEIAFFDGFYTNDTYQVDFDFNQPILNATNIYEKWVDAIPIFAFMQGIQNVPNDLNTSQEHQEYLKALRQAYLGLTSDQLRFLGPQFEKDLVEFEIIMYDMLQAEAFMVALDELPWIPYLEDQEAIEDVLSMYDALTPNQRQYLTVQSVHKLFDVATQYERLSEATEVSLSILSLPKHLTYEDYDRVSEVVKAFYELGELEKALVDPDAVIQLFDAFAKTEDWKDVSSFVKQVQAITDPLNLANEASILALNESYIALSSYAKSIIPEIIVDRYLELQKMIQDMLIASEVDETLKRLPTSINTNNEASFKEALKAYRGLSLDQKALLSPIAQTQIQMILSYDQVDTPNQETILETSYFPWLAVLVSGSFILGVYLYNKRKALGL